MLKETHFIIFSSSNNRLVNTNDIVKDNQSVLEFHILNFWVLLVIRN